MLSESASLAPSSSSSPVLLRSEPLQRPGSHFLCHRASSRGVLLRKLSENPKRGREERSDAATPTPPCPPAALSPPPDPAELWPSLTDEAAAASRAARDPGRAIAAGRCGAVRAVPPGPGCGGRGAALGPPRLRPRHWGGAACGSLLSSDGAG